MAHSLHESRSWLVQDEAATPHALLQKCYQDVAELRRALSHMDKAGTYLTQSLAQVLQATVFRSVGDVLISTLGDVYSSAWSKSNENMLEEMENVISGLQKSDIQQTDSQLYAQGLCHVSLLFTKLKKQYFALCHGKMIDLVHALLCLKGEDSASGEVTKLVLKLGLADGLDSPNKSNSSLPSTPWGSPKSRKAHQDSGKSPSRSGFRIMSLFEKKSAPARESRSSFYVEVEEQGSEGPRDQNKAVPVGSVTSGSHEDMKTRPVIQTDPFSTTMGQGLSCASHYLPIQGDLISFSSVPETSMTADQTFHSVALARPQLATEEELESVINLLSGTGYGLNSPMQVIPEVPPQDPLQLTVPQMFRMPSPASDTQLEELRHQKVQVHRRSEGCLDLSAMGRNTWPHQQLQHRASLPSVQIISASGQRTDFDSLPPSPIPGYMRDTPSPSHRVRDQPSPNYFRHDPPSPFRAHHANTLGIGGIGLCGRPTAISPLQWRGMSMGSGGGSRIGGGMEFGSNQHGTWPIYGGLSSMSAGMGDASSWTGPQDCSDPSDDSSTEDQFFAVGKDLCQVIGSKDGSSDEDGDGGMLGQAKNSSTWPPPSGHSSHGLGESHQAFDTHRVVQMQWSDPMPSHSVWAAGPPDVTSHKTSPSVQGFGNLQ